LTFGKKCVKIIINKLNSFEDNTFRFLKFKIKVFKKIKIKI